MLRIIADSVEPSVLWSTPRTTWSFWAIFMRTSVPLCFCAPSVVIGLGGYPLFLTVDASYLSALLLCVPVYWPVSWGSAILLLLGLVFQSHAVARASSCPCIRFLEDDKSVLVVRLANGMPDCSGGRQHSVLSSASTRANHFVGYGVGRRRALAHISQYFTLVTPSLLLHTL